jgi:histone-lysine N-methyltransferase SETMAR
MQVNVKAWSGNTRHYPVPRNSKSASKVMLTLSWDFKGPILNYFQHNGQTRSSARYCAMLQEELKPTTRSKRRGFMTNGVVLHHNNAQPHTAAATVEMIRKLKFDLISHPANSPDLAVSYYYNFGPLKQAVREHRFANFEDIEETVHTLFHVQPKTFCADV